MYASEIRERIARDRGLNCYFQIQPEEPLVRIGAGRWGLANRDIPFSTGEGSAIMDRLVTVLHERGKGLHVSEIRSVLETTVPEVAKVEDPTLFFGLAHRDGRCAVGKGQYVYLREWGEPRRVTVVEAVRRTLEAAGRQGLTLDQVVAGAEAVIERPLPRLVVGYACSNIGANYDEASLRWTISSAPETEGAAESDLEAA
jgi:hypothetical protein